MDVVQIRVGDQSDDRSERQSTLCAHQVVHTLAGGFARRFTCAAPLFGRYVHVAQRPANTYLLPDPDENPDLYPQIAVFGALQRPDQP